MSESSDVYVVALSEDDISGSSLSGRKPEELKNQELLFWLKCRGDNGKGLKTKAQLVKRYGLATVKIDKLYNFDSFSCTQYMTILRNDIKFCLFNRVNEYIRTGRDKNVLDPSPHKVYSRRKESENQRKELESTNRNETAKERVKFPDDENEWSSSLETIPLFTRAHMDNHIKKSGKNIANKEHHSIPTGLRKAKTFLEDEYLESIRCSHDQSYFYVKANCCLSFRKNDPPHSLKLALCIITEEVESSNCSCVAGKVGYCNHILALMFKLCKFSLFGCKFTEDLSSDSDQQAKLACTSQLQQWHKKGGGANICPEPVMEMVINKTRLDEEQARCGVKCNLYEARMKVTHSKTDKQNLKIELSKINPNMGFSQMLVDEDEARPTVQTKFGNCVVGSYLSYQVGFTESNFKATIDLHCIPRQSVPNKENELNYSTPGSQ